MSEARGYSVAVNAFRTQYDYLPGDYGAIISGVIPSVAGDQDGKIEYLAGQGIWWSIREGVNAWFHLINSGIIDNKLTLNWPIRAFNGQHIPFQVVGTNIPASKLDGVGWVFANTAAGNVVIATGDIDSGLLGSVNPSVENQQFATPGVITPSDALSIDTKLDDGLANAGRVRSYAYSYVIYYQPGFCSNGSEYRTAIKDKACALEFTIDIS